MSGAAPRASIVIVTSTNRRGLAACLRSLAAARPAVSHEVIVVLNGADEAMAAMAGELDGVEVVESAVNRGFAGGSNLGRSRAQGEFIVLLHDDAAVDAGWLEALVRCADERPDAGAVGSRVLDPDGTLQSAGCILWRDGRTAQPGTDVAIGEDAVDRRRGVDYASSSSLLVRAEAWDAIGGLDDRFHPAYYIDVDLAMALRGTGRTVLYEPAARVRHERGASGARPFREFVSERNRHAFLAKWAEPLARHLTGSEPDAVRRACDRAEAEAEELRSRWTGGTRPRSPIPAVPSHHRFLRVERELQRAYADELLARIDRQHQVHLAEQANVRRLARELDDQLEANREGEARRQALVDELARLQCEVDRLRDALGFLEARSARLAAIESGGWWRLRERLLPLLRLRAALSRRGRSSRTG